MIEQRDHCTPFTSEYAHGKCCFFNAVRHRLEPIGNHTDDLVRRQQFPIGIVDTDAETIKDIPNIVRIALQICQRPGKESNVLREIGRTHTDLTRRKGKFRGCRNAHAASAREPRERLLVLNRGMRRRAKDTDDCNARRADCVLHGGDG